MSTLTTNYGLVKPALTDSPPDITVMNPNWDRIDDELKNHSSQLAQKVNIGNDYRPNLLINGDFQVWQRGTSIDKTAVSGRFYAADRWCCFRGGYNAGLVVSKVDGGMTVTNPNTAYACEIDQSLESVVVKPLRNKSVTFSVKLKSNNSANASITVWYNNSSEHIPGTAATSNIASYTGVVGTSLTTFTCTGVVPADAVGLCVVIQTDSATTLTVEYAKLEVNDHATPLIPKSYGEELALCQRYYEKSYSDGVAPLTPSNTSGIESKVVPSNTVNTAQQYGKVNFKVNKRVTPNITVYPYTTPTNAYRVSNNAGVDLASNSGIVTYVGTSGFCVYNGGSPITTVDNSIIFHWVADAEI